MAGRRIKLSMSGLKECGAIGPAKPTMAEAGEAWNDEQKFESSEE